MAKIYDLIKEAKSLDSDNYEAKQLTLPLHCLPNGPTMRKFRQSNVIRLCTREKCMNPVRKGCRVCDECKEKTAQLYSQKCSRKYSTQIRTQAYNQKEPVRDKQTKKKSGLGIEQRKQLAAYQHFVCYFCKEAAITHQSNLDHCHVTSLIRGLACTNCNKQILANHAMRVIKQLYNLDLAAIALSMAPAQKCFPGAINSQHLQYRKKTIWELGSI